MKIGVLSDLHIDKNKEGLIEGETFSSLVSELIDRQSVDVFLLAGDVSDDYRITQEFIETVKQKSGVPLYFVPGNHDYWSINHEVKDTNRLHDFFAEQEESLISRPRILNDEWAVVGNPGWYDYGYGNRQVYSYDQFASKKYKFAYWNDARYINWGRSDQEVSQEMLDQLKEDISKVGGRKIILMTHVATHPNFVMQLPHRLYDFANAYLGAKSYEELYGHFPQIKYSIMGHVHFRKVVKEFNKTFLSACLGNRKHWLYKDNPGKELEESLLTFEI